MKDYAVVTGKGNGDEGIFQFEKDITMMANNGYVIKTMTSVYDNEGDCIYHTVIMEMSEEEVVTGKDGE